MMSDVGNFPLTTTEKLPNIDVAFPGERWSDAKATEAITPGAAVVPVNSGGRLGLRLAASADAITQMAVAMHTVQPPDVNTGPTQKHPNELENVELAAGDYVLRYYSGGFNLTLFVPSSAYVPGDLLGWKPGGTRPTGKSGTGAWAKAPAAGVGPAFFEVIAFKPLAATPTEGVLEVRSLRSQF